MNNVYYNSGLVGPAPINQSSMHEDEIEKIINEVKNQGVFDEFRRDCISDVDTKPAYQNLRSRVETTIQNFLEKLKFDTSLNKNVVRENLRKHVIESSYYNPGLDRITDQIVNPKMMPVLYPKVEKIVCDHLNIPYVPSELPAPTASLQPSLSYANTNGSLNNHIPSLIPGVPASENQVSDPAEHKDELIPEVKADEEFETEANRESEAHYEEQGGVEDMDTDVSPKSEPAEAVSSLSGISDLASHGETDSNGSSNASPDQLTGHSTADNSNSNSLLPPGSECPNSQTGNHNTTKETKNSTNESHRSKKQSQQFNENSNSCSEKDETSNPSENDRFNEDSSLGASTHNSVRPLSSLKPDLLNIGTVDVANLRGESDAKSDEERGNEMDGSKHKATAGGSEEEVENGDEDEQKRKMNKEETEKKIRADNNDRTEDKINTDEISDDAMDVDEIEDGEVNDDEDEGYKAAEKEIAKDREKSVKLGKERGSEDEGLERISSSDDELPSMNYGNEKNSNGKYNNQRSKGGNEFNDDENSSGKNKFEKNSKDDESDSKHSSSDDESPATPASNRMGLKSLDKVSSEERSQDSMAMEIDELSQDSTTPAHYTRRGSESADEGSKKNKPRDYRSKEDNSSDFQSKVDKSTESISKGVVSNKSGSTDSKPNGSRDKHKSSDRGNEISSRERHRDREKASSSRDNDGAGERDSKSSRDRTGGERDGKSSSRHSSHSTDRSRNKNDESHRSRRSNYSSSNSKAGPKSSKEKDTSEKDRSNVLKDKEKITKEESKSREKKENEGSGSREKSSRDKEGSTSEDRNSDRPSKTSSGTSSRDMTRESTTTSDKDRESVKRRDDKHRSSSSRDDRSEKHRHSKDRSGKSDSRDSKRDKSDANHYSKRDRPVHDGDSQSESEQRTTSCRDYAESRNDRSPPKSPDGEKDGHRGLRQKSSSAGGREKERRSKSGASSEVEKRGRKAPGGDWMMDSTSTDKMDEEVASFSSVPKMSAPPSGSATSPPLDRDQFTPPLVGTTTPKQCNTEEKQQLTPSKTGRKEIDHLKRLLDLCNKRILKEQESKQQNEHEEIDMDASNEGIDTALKENSEAHVENEPLENSKCHVTSDKKEITPYKEESEDMSTVRAKSKFEPEYTERIDYRTIEEDVPSNKSEMLQEQENVTHIRNEKDCDEKKEATEDVRDSKAEVVIKEKDTSAADKKVAEQGQSNESAEVELKQKNKAQAEKEPLDFVQIKEADNVQKMTHPNVNKPATVTSSLNKPVSHKTSQSSAHAKLSNTPGSVKKSAKLQCVKKLVEINMWDKEKADGFRLRKDFGKVNKSLQDKVVGSEQNSRKTDQDQSVPKNTWLAVNDHSKDGSELKTPKKNAMTSSKSKENLTGENEINSKKDLSKSNEKIPKLNDNVHKSKEKLNSKQDLSRNQEDLVSNVEHEEEEDTTVISLVPELLGIPEDELIKALQVTVNVSWSKTLSSTAADTHGGKESLTDGKTDSGHGKKLSPNGKTPSNRDTDRVDTVYNHLKKNSSEVSETLNEGFSKKTATSMKEMLKISRERHMKKQKSIEEDREEINGEKENKEAIRIESKDSIEDMKQEGHKKQDNRLNAKIAHYEKLKQSLEKRLRLKINTALSLSHLERVKNILAKLSAKKRSLLQSNGNPLVESRVRVREGGKTTEKNKRGDILRNITTFQAKVIKDSEHIAVNTLETFRRRGTKETIQDELEEDKETRSKSSTEDSNYSSRSQAPTDESGEKQANMTEKKSPKLDKSLIDNKSKESRKIAAIKKQLQELKNKKFLMDQSLQLRLEESQSNPNSLKKSPQTSPNSKIIVPAHMIPRLQLEPCDQLAQEYHNKLLRLKSKWETNKTDLKTDKESSEEDLFAAIKRKIAQEIRNKVKSSPPRPESFASSSPRQQITSSAVVDLTELRMQKNDIITVYNTNYQSTTAPTNKCETKSPRKLVTQDMDSRTHVQSGKDSIEEKGDAIQTESIHGGSTVTSTADRLHTRTSGQCCNPVFDEEDEFTKRYVKPVIESQNQKNLRVNKGNEEILQTSKTDNPHQQTITETSSEDRYCESINDENYDNGGPSEDSLGQKDIKSKIFEQLQQDFLNNQEKYAIKTKIVETKDDKSRIFEELEKRFYSNPLMYKEKSPKKKKLTNVLEQKLEKAIEDVKEKVKGKTEEINEKTKMSLFEELQQDFYNNQSKYEEHNESTTENDEDIIEIDDKSACNNDDNFQSEIQDKMHPEEKEPFLGFKMPEKIAAIIELHKSISADTAEFINKRNTEKKTVSKQNGDDSKDKSPSRTKDTTIQCDKKDNLQEKPFTGFKVTEKISAIKKLHNLTDLVMAMEQYLANITKTGVDKKGRKRKHGDMERKKSDAPGDKPSESNDKKDDLANNKSDSLRSGNSKEVTPNIKTPEKVTRLQSTTEDFTPTDKKSRQQRSSEESGYGSVDQNAHEEQDSLNHRTSRYNQSSCERNRMDQDTEGLKVPAIIIRRKRVVKKMEDQDVRTRGRERKNVTRDTNADIGSDTDAEIDQDRVGENSYDDTDYDVNNETVSRDVDERLGSNVNGTYTSESLQSVLDAVNSDINDHVVAAQIKILPRGGSSAPPRPRRPPSGIQQRYDSADLYKPRMTFASKRRKLSPS